MTKLNKSHWVSFAMVFAIAFSCLVISQSTNAINEVTEETMARAELIKQSRVPLPDLVVPSKTVFSGTAAAVPADVAGMEDGIYVDQRPQLLESDRQQIQKVEKPSVGGAIRKGGGQDLATATVIASLPYTDTDNTTGASDVASEDCAWGLTNVGDLWYSYTPTASHYMDVSLCASDAGFDALLFVYEDAHTAGAPLGCDDDGCSSYGPSEITGIVALVGHTYYIVVDGWMEGEYTINVTGAPDPLACPPGALTEGEACGVLNNDMEWTDPYTTPESIADGDVYCGTLFSGVLPGDVDPTRDRDFYEIIVPAGPAMAFHITCIGDEGPAGTYIMVDDSGAFGGAYAFAWVSIAEPADVWFTLEPGKYYIRVNLNGTAPGAECGTGTNPLSSERRYILTLDATIPVYQDGCFAPEILSGDVTDHPYDLTGMTGGESGVGLPPAWPAINMWFEYTATCNGLVTITSCMDAPAGHLLAAYSACHTDPLAWTWNGGSPDGCPIDGPLSIQLPMSLGQTILIEIESPFGDEVQGTLTTDCMVLEMHNDDCVDAIDIGVGEIDARFWWNLGATTDTLNGLNHPRSCDAIGKDVWFKWTADCDSWVEVSLCEDNPWDTKIAGYLGATCPDVDIRIPIACNDDGCGNAGPSSMWFVAEAGQEYLLRFGGWELLPSYVSAEGAGTFFITCYPDRVVPDNDACQDADMQFLPGNGEITFTGDNTDCTDQTCLLFGNVVWIGFTMDTCQDITVSYCITETSHSGWMGNFNLVNACPCLDGQFLTDFEYYNCPSVDERIQIYRGLNPGAYYWPVKGDDEAGPYTIEISGEEVECTICAGNGNQCDEGIARFQLGDIDNNTGTCDNYVDFYDTHSTVLYKGINYDFRVENVESGPFYDQDYCGIWVDWNRDFDFWDAGETIAVFGGPGDGPYSGTLTPNLDARLGDIRLRVRITFGKENDEACGPQPFGEVEDYKVVVREFVCGDWDNDGVFDADDVLAAYNYYLNGGPPPVLGLIVGDFNGDGEFTIEDLLAIIDSFNNGGPAGNCLGL